MFYDGDSINCWFSMAKVIVVGSVHTYVVVGFHKIHCYHYNIVKPLHLYGMRLSYIIVE